MYLLFLLLLISGTWLIYSIRKGPKRSAAPSKRRIFYSLIPACIGAAILIYDMAVIAPNESGWPIMSLLFAMAGLVCIAITIIVAPIVAISTLSKIKQEELGYVTNLQDIDVNEKERGEYIYKSLNTSLNSNSKIFFALTLLVLGCLTFVLAFRGTFLIENLASIILPILIIVIAYAIILIMAVIPLYNTDDDKIEYIFRVKKYSKYIFIFFTLGVFLTPALQTFYFKDSYIDRDIGISETVSMKRAIDKVVDTNIYKYSSYELSWYHNFTGLKDESDLEIFTKYDKTAKDDPMRGYIIYNKKTKAIKLLDVDSNMVKQAVRDYFVSKGVEVKSVWINGRGQNDFESARASCSIGRDFTIKCKVSIDVNTGKINLVSMLDEVKENRHKIRAMQSFGEKVELKEAFNAREASMNEVFRRLDIEPIAFERYSAEYGYDILVKRNDRLYFAYIDIKDKSISLITYPRYNSNNTSAPEFEITLIKNVRDLYHEDVIKDLI